MPNLALAGIVISHFSHYLSMLALYRLTKQVFGNRSKGGEKNMSLPMLSGLLYIINPAGAFLSAPYAEAPFAFFSFAGFYAFIRGLRSDRRGEFVSRDAGFLLSGILFTIATAIRSNGILGGILFAHEAVLVARYILLNGLSWSAFRRLFIICAGGGSIALGMAGPQFVAYRRYCLVDSPRPWCESLVPSIYSWVQDHYWYGTFKRCIIVIYELTRLRNVGFLRYWTIPNLPLFCMAAPMLFIMLRSSWVLIRFGSSGRPDKGKEHERQNDDADNEFTQECLNRLALPQAALALLAITSYHVQIITRLASAYPLWHWYLASFVQDEAKGGRVRPGWMSSTLILRGVMLYGMIQASLFASFLPPA